MRIGLTGGIAAGKSTVAAHLRGEGAYVIDYDLLAREVVKPGSSALQKIVREFGRDVLDADGFLDRAQLAHLVFGRRAKPDARRRLDAIEHPEIYRLAQRCERSKRQMANGGHMMVVHDVPLLAEVIEEMPFTFDHILTVEAPEEVRIGRMMTTRSMSRDQAVDRIRSQSSSAQREAIADAVVDAATPIEQMFDYVDTLVAQWRAA